MLFVELIYQPEVNLKKLWYNFKGIVLPGLTFLFLGKLKP